MNPIKLVMQINMIVMASTMYSAMLLANAAGLTYCLLKDVKT